MRRADESGDRRGPGGLFLLLFGLAGLGLGIWLFRRRRAP
jgi:hypothetical protein